jgi:PAS domain S-box-containing protein
MENSILEMALDAAGIAILVLDDSDRIIEVNAPAARLVGRERDEMIGAPVSAFLPIGPIRSLVLDAGSMATPAAVIEVAGQDRAGRARPISVNAVRCVDPTGRALTSLFLRDLATERDVGRATHNHLIQSDNAIRGAGIGVFEYDPTADTVSVSDIWRNMLELHPGEDIDVQQEWRGRVHPEDLADALEPIRLCTEEQVERASCEYRLHSRDRAHWRWMRTDIAVAQRDETGKPVLLVGAQTDITERKTTEEALRVSVAQFRSAFENASIGKAIVGLDGTLSLVNPAFCAMLGYSEGELQGENIRSIAHPDDLAEDTRNLGLLVDGQIPFYTMEKRFLRANGAVMWARFSVGLVRDSRARPDHLIAQVVDVTEERRLDQLRSEFVSVVSHELRTPLTAILGALMLLEFEDDSRFSDEVQRLLFIAKTNGDRLRNLIEDILDFQKFSARQMRFSLSMRPVVPLVEEALLANLALTDRYGVQFRPQIDDRSPVGFVDAKRFQQVMANLLSNAAKFANPGSSITITTRREERFVRVSVSNEGPGIPASFRDRVFKPFSQAASMSDRRSGGTGLGLSITKQIVEQMGGEIGFESVEGDRTVFWFTVRAAEHP